MAENNFSHTVRSLQEKSICPLCKKFYCEPVTAKCGHSFCQACIDKTWKKCRSIVQCPVCKKRFLKKCSTRPNTELGNLTAIATQFFPENPDVSRVCEKHKEIMKLFCQMERVPICVSCKESREHQDHPTIPIDEAVQEYKGKIEVHLDRLKRKREKIVYLTTINECRAHELEKKIKLERHRVESEFAQKQTFLEIDRQMFLSRIDREEEMVMQKVAENLNKLNDQTATMDQLLCEIERKTLQKGAHLLVGLDRILDRCEAIKMEPPELFNVEVKNNICNLPRQYLILREMAKSKVNLVDLMVDPETAHPSIVVTEDLKNAIRLATEKDVSCNPCRFDTAPCILGTEGFTVDIHFWHVEVDLASSCWALGVAAKSVRRKGPLKLTPEEGVWALEFEQDHFQIHTSPVCCEELPHHGNVSCIGVFLDCDCGQVSFYSADTMSLIHTFSHNMKEEVFPIFFLGTEGVHFTMCPP
ncbi:E3 ubiquitin-protein ligase TRIM39-like [Ambystoma mexicanum]|uniref:E3 ubiquitin-protein ligase TRIM39-like n=1 Tax=Ambystoma mexicanum TaxID=8296 RepID=UPI0037E70B2A